MGQAQIKIGENIVNVTIVIFVLGFQVLLG